MKAAAKGAQWARRISELLRGNGFLFIVMKKTQKWM